MYVCVCVCCFINNSIFCESLISHGSWRNVAASAVFIVPPYGAKSGMTAKYLLDHMVGSARVVKRASDKHCNKFVQHLQAYAHTYTYVCIYTNLNL